jgi:quinol monooxygenase YgiN
MKLKFGLQGKLIAKEGCGDELTNLMLEASKMMQATDDCDLYVVGQEPDQPDHIWIYEVWSDEQAHQGSLQLPGVQQLIGKARPLIAGMADQQKLKIKSEI